jgi:hypothetical protein
MRTAARLHAHDPLGGQRLRTRQDELILLSVNIVGDYIEIVEFAETLSESLDKRRLAGANRPSYSDSEWTIMPRRPTPSAQTAAQEVAPTAAPLSPELAQMLQTMARDLANVEQGIEQLKTSQQQMGSDNAKAIEQLKTSQEQMARDNAKAAEQLKASQEQIARFIAKASEQNLRPKTSAPPPRPIAKPDALAGADASVAAKCAGAVGFGRQAEGGARRSEAVRHFNARFINYRNNSQPKRPSLSRFDVPPTLLEYPSNGVASWHL